MRSPNLLFRCPYQVPLFWKKDIVSWQVKEKNIENKVRAIVRLIESRGEDLFPSLWKEGSSWFQDDFCIFVWTENGTQVVCPSDRNREGKNMKWLVDADGKPIRELFIETALSEKMRVESSTTDRR